MMSVSRRGYAEANCPYEARQSLSASRLSGAISTDQAKTSQKQCLARMNGLLGSAGVAE